MIVISTNNPRIILDHKLNVLGQAREFITHTFSSVSDFNRIVKSREFYAGICERLGIRPEQMLHVGDDPKHDLTVPRSVGMSVLLIDREGRAGEGAIHSLSELARLLGGIT